MLTARALPLHLLLALTLLTSLAGPTAGAQAVAGHGDVVLPECPDDPVVLVVRGEALGGGTWSFDAVLESTSRDTFCLEAGWVLEMTGSWTLEEGGCLERFNDYYLCLTEPTDHGDVRRFQAYFGVPGKQWSGTVDLHVA